jgi:hypothetical protein
MYDWFETVYQTAISITIYAKLICSVEKEVENCVGRLTVLDGLGEWICCEVNPSLFSIVGQGGIENALKIGRGHSTCT